MIFYTGDTLLVNLQLNLEKNLGVETACLHKLLPEQLTHDHYLRPRSHDRSLSVKTDNNNFKVDYYLKTCISYLVNIISFISTFPLLGNPTIVFRVHLFHVTCRSGLTAMH